SLHSLFLLSPRHPSSTLFPYTTLFRSAPEYIQNQIGQFFGNGRHRNISCIYVAQKYHKIPTFIRENASHLVIFNSGSSHEDISRSEEHTSELQSPYDLVCRLLLEKKKT